MAMSGELNLFGILAWVLTVYPYFTSCNSPIVVPTITSNECDLEVISETKTVVKLFLNMSIDSSENTYTSLPPVDTSNNSRPIQITELFGIQHGPLWDDNILTHLPTIIGIKTITVSFGAKINSIQINYRLGDGTTHFSLLHGSVTERVASIILADDERITRVQGFTNSLGITELSFVTKNSSGFEVTFGPYGSIGEKSFNISGYILGFRGYALASIFGLSIYYLPPLFKSEVTYGGSGRTYAFDDNVDAIIPPVVGIENIIVHAGHVIDALQSTYKLLGGGIHRGHLIGGRGGGTFTIDLEEGDILFQLIGRSNGPYLNNLELYINKSSTHNTTKFGTYGRAISNTPFKFVGVILGFYGFAEYDRPLDHPLCSRIGVYTL